MGENQFGVKRRLGGTNMDKHIVNTCYPQHTVFSTTPLKQHNAIADSGCTKHYFTLDNKCINWQKDTMPIIMRLPNNQTMKSTHTVELLINNITDKAKIV